MIKNIFIYSALCAVLTSCAVTPQEKAQERLNFQVSLARECDPIAADLMAELPKISTLDKQQRASFDKEYQERVNNPTFQSCYNMAFKSYSEQQQLNLQQMEWDSEAGFFNNPPFNCEFYPPEGSYWGAC
ncbi:hypothetical protein [Providencia stuartii]|uniref:hypothetical protein n=2 Tax=Providencia TaxID=586 RepID=UPI0024AC30F3|nr:hypothetical protein [Providencia stuartii]MCX3072506.1 hypothetical protein [Providencia stuartii]